MDTSIFSPILKRRGKMQKDRMTKVAGLVMVLALVSVVMAGTVPAQTHTVFAEFGTATW
jgi:hypothetical protein